MLVNKRTALIVVDVQNDFLENGALPVARASEIIAPINLMSRHFALVAFSQDWHPHRHVSFASSHSGACLYDTIITDYGLQTLWPDHCIAQTAGAEFASELSVPDWAYRVRKGVETAVDSYSAFWEADHKTATSLNAWLQNHLVQRLFICGLATDFCVSWTALDGAALGYEVFVVEDACRSIDVGGSLDIAHKQWDEAGIKTVKFSQIINKIS